MDLDQETLESLPRSQRLRFAKKARQEQLKKYYHREWEERQEGKEEPVSSPNSKGLHVNFDVSYQLRDAVTQFDDKEVLSLLDQGADPNTASECGITLLHQCCMDDNIIVAELLIQRGADVNIQDDDWWTPLHAACACETVEIVQLLLNNGADPTLLDLDANLPIDHAQDGSETRQVIQTHLQKNGLDEITLRNLKRRDALRMLADVKDFLLTGGDINTSNENMTTLLHIAAANNYREVGKLLLDKGAEIDPVDDDGMTPLHVASKYGNLKMLKLLVRRNANPMLLNYENEKPVDLAATELIEEILKSAEQVYTPNQKVSPVFLIEEEEEASGLMDGSSEADQGRIATDRASSKTQRRHMSMSKTEMMFEAETRVPGNGDRCLSESSRSIGLKVVPDEERRSNEGFRGIGLKVVPDDKMVYLPNSSSTDDLANMSELTENMILQELMLRYCKDVIYTYVGDMLIAVNPFKVLPIYSSQVSDKYTNINSRGDLTPHIFGLADTAYQSMLRERQSQCCIISGESGAGKTETCKLVVQHLLVRAHSSESLLNEKIEQLDINWELIPHLISLVLESFLTLASCAFGFQSKLTHAAFLQVNPLLECFGNAQTTMNDNSSRFGKFLELLFSSEGRVQGARISEYLLEKSRVIQQGERERNFHIFYMLFAGLTEDEKQLFGLRKPEEHRYLKPSTNMNRCVYSNCIAKFTAVRDCLTLIGFTKDDENSLFRTLSAVVLLGDLKFEESGDVARLLNTEVLDSIALSLQVSADELASSIMSETTYTRAPDGSNSVEIDPDNPSVRPGEAITKVRSVSQASECCDALAKAIYSRLFSWVVNNINQLLQPLEGSEAGYEIGILDIFGFENFGKNSFEQMCINLANEQLQHYFNEHIFLREQDECESEGIALDRISFTNNKPVLDVFLEKHLGVLALLDEESNFPRGTDRSLATKLHNGPGVRAKNIYKAPKDGGLSFEIFHYAGIVNYDLSGVLEKNKDTLAKSVLFTMKTSSSPLIREMFQFRVTRTGSLAPSVRQRTLRKSVKSIKKPRDAFEFFKQKRKSDRQSKHQKGKKNKSPAIGMERKGPATLAYHFKNSLMELVNKMMMATPHFVRCIKPNTAKLPDKFTPEYVIAQLRYTGVMETTRIRQQGFPLRITAQEFLERYEAMELFSGIDSKRLDKIDRCKATLRHYSITEWKIGYSKLFFRYWHVEKLNDISIKLEDKIIMCQKVVRGFITRRLVMPMYERTHRQKIFIGHFLSQIQTRGQEFHQRQQVQNDYDEQRMVDDIFEDVINIAEMEAQNLTRQNGSLNGRLDSHSQVNPVGSDCASHPANNDYVKMSGNKQQQAQEQNVSSGSYMSQGSFTDMIPYDDSNAYESNHNRLPRKSVLPYQTTVEKLQGLDLPIDEEEDVEERFIDRRMSDDVFTNGDHMNGEMPPPPPPPQPPKGLELPGMPPPPPVPPVLQMAATVTSSIPSLGYEPEVSMPPPPPMPVSGITQNGHNVQTQPEKVYTDVAGGADVLLPPLPPMPEGSAIVDDGLSEEFPPPPPMAEFSSEAKQNIAAIRNKFLQKESDSTTSPPPGTPGQQKKGSPRESSSDDALGPSPGIAAKLAHFHEKQQELSSPPPQPKQNGASPRKFVMPTTPPVQQQQQEETVKRRPPAPTRDPTTRLTVMASGNQKLSGIPETERSGQESIYASVDDRRQQPGRNRIQSSHTVAGVEENIDYASIASLKQFQRLSMQNVPPPPSTPPPRPPPMKTIPPAPVEAPPPLPDRSLRHNSTGNGYSQGMSPRMSPTSGGNGYSQGMSQGMCPPSGSREHGYSQGMSPRMFPPTGSGEHGYSQGLSSRTSTGEYGYSQGISPRMSPPSGTGGNIYSQGMSPRITPAHSSGGHCYSQGMSPRISPAQSSGGNGYSQGMSSLHQTQGAPVPPLPPQTYSRRPPSTSVPPAPMKSTSSPPSMTNAAHMVHIAPSGNMAYPASIGMHSAPPPGSRTIQHTTGGMATTAPSGMASHSPYFQSNVAMTQAQPVAPSYTSSYASQPPPPPENNNFMYMPTTMSIPPQESVYAIYAQPHDTFSAPPPPPPPAPMGMPPPPPNGIPPPPPGVFSNIPAPPVVPAPPRVPAAPTPPRIPPANMGGGLQNGLGNVQLRKTERPDKKKSTGEAPMDNLMAELQMSGFRLRPTPKQAKGPTNEMQDPEDELDTDADDGHEPARSEPPPVRSKTRTISIGEEFLPAMHSTMVSNFPPPVKSPGPAPKPKPKKKSTSDTEPDNCSPFNGSGSSGLPLEFEEELASLPPWKRAMREKKIKEELKKRAAEQKIKDEEAAKWAGIPDWKKQMMLKKEKKKQEEAEAAIDKEAVEMEKKLQAMPAWKREIVQKKMLEGEGNK